MDTSKNPKYFCKDCNFYTANKKDFNRHEMTAKHKSRVNNKETDTAKNPTTFQCDCGMEYRYKSGLYRHRRNCKKTPKDNLNNANVLDVLIRQQEKHQEENIELKKMLFEQQENHHKQMKLQQEQMMQQQEQLKQQQEEHNKQIQELIPQLQQVTNINNCNNTTNNNRFNLNFFLNEQCKDAISIQNFIENLNIGIPELEHMGNVGYVQGMMSIFSNTLGAMDIYKRPLHCTDLKRETLYIKQGNTWKKDTEDKTELKKLIKTVEYKNYGSLRLWEREHPEAFECDTQDNIDYMRISNESLGGFDSTDAIKLGKIMKHVVREVYIK